MATLTRPAGPSTPAEGSATRRHARLAAGVAVVLGVAGVGYRLAAVLAGVPPTNSDEGTMGLAALHIAQGRELPIYFYGQHYMGTIEAYLAAPLFAVAGPSLLALRAPNLLLYAVFLAVMWSLTRRVFSPWLATATVGVLALGADRILKNQLIAGGGYPEINPAGAGLLLLGVALAAAPRPRTAGYALFGLVTGLMLWDDWLVLPYVAAAVAVLLLRRPTRRALAWLAGGLLVGAAPLIVHDLTSPWRNSAIVTFFGLGGAGPDPSLADRLYGGVLFGIPLGTGMCLPGRCTPVQLGWAVAWLALLAVAGVLAWRDRSDRVVRAARLGLVVAAAASVVLYARSTAAGNSPVESARYLHCLLISTPAVLWPLWSLLRSPRWRWVGAAGLAAVAALALAATVAVVRALPEIAAVDDRQPALLAELDRRGVTGFYSDYWTCDYVAFASAERVRCAVIDADLTRGYDRYRPYRADVAAAAPQTLALPVGTPASGSVRAALAASGVPFRHDVVAGYDLYQPAARVDLPRG